MALGSETSNLLIKISADASASKQAFTQLNQSMNGLASTAMKVGTAIGGALALGDIINRTRTWGKELDLVNDVMGVGGAKAAQYVTQAKIVGATAEDVAQSFGILENQIYAQAEAITKGTSDFDKFGIQVLNAQRQIRPMGDIMDDIREKLRGLDAPGQAIIERQLFGRGGPKLHDLLTLTKDDITEIDKFMRDLGIEVSTGGINAMEKMEREMNKLAIIFDIIKVQIGSFIIPLLVNLGRNVLPLVSGAFKVVGEAMRVPLSILKDLFERMRVFASDLKEKGVWGAITALATDLIKEVGKILGNVGAWISDNWPAWREAIGKLWDDLVDWVKNTGWPTLVSVMENQVPAFANWIVQSLPTWTTNFAALIKDVVQWLIGTGIPTIVSALVVAIPKVGGWLLDVVGWMSHIGIPAALDTLFKIGGAIVEGILAGLGDLKTKLWNIIVEAFPVARDIENALRRMVNGTAPGLNEPGGPIGPPNRNPPINPIQSPPPGSSIPTPGFIPDVPISTVFAGIGSGIGQVGSGIGDFFHNIGVPGFAEGGIVRRPTLAMIGESGPEAVVPLGRGGSGNTFVFNIGSVDSASRAREVAQEVARLIMRSGASAGNYSYAFLGVLAIGHFLGMLLSAGGLA